LNASAALAAQAATAILGFATVTFELPHPEADFNVAASALIFDRSGLRIATIDSAHRAIFKGATIARDLGSEVEINSGLTAGRPRDPVAAGRYTKW
jgi:hypothetical protein